MLNIKLYQNNSISFWNDFNNIEWFKRELAPQYWIDFFKKHSHAKYRRVLDLGCGAGRNTEMLFSLGFDTYGCDLYKNMIKVTKKRLIKAGIEKEVVNNHILLRNMINTGFNKNYFNFVVSNGVYHNAYCLDEFNLAIKETSSILKPGGYLCINTFSSEHIDHTFKKIEDHIYVTKEGLVMTLLSSREFIKICESHKLKPIETMVQYNRQVSTGVRSVMRGVFQKK